MVGKIIKDYLVEIIVYSTYEQYGDAIRVEVLTLLEILPGASCLSLSSIIDGFKWGPEEGAHDRLEK